MLGIAVALAAAGGGAAAIAASGSESPAAENQAIIDDAAKQLGISPDKLGAALKQALSDRIDAAVAAGRLTKAEGDRDAAVNLAQAAQTMRGSPGAMQLRTLQTIDGLGPTASNTVVLAIPVEVMNVLAETGALLKERHLGG